MYHSRMRTRGHIQADVARWSEAYGGGLPQLFLRKREFRNLLYHRLARAGRGWKALARVLRIVFPGERTLFLRTDDIGPGLFIQHGFATTVGAERLGANCWINQQVTIGHQGNRRPILEDGVAVHAGAIVLGGVTMHRGSRAAAAALVLRDVPAGVTVAGVPASPITTLRDRERMDS